MEFWNHTRYTKLFDHDIPGDESHKEPRRKSYIYPLLIAICFIAGGAGYFAAQSYSEYSDHHTKLYLNTMTHTFRYNRSFSYPPSNHTNYAWREIFPAQGGFFVNPTIAPTRSTFSVFHQLHCVNALRGAYWASHLAALEGRKISDEDLPIDIQESHVRHCVDLIRQSLMCLADTTLEVVDESINGVHGFRTPHQCKDWEQLKEWTTAQQEKTKVEQIV